jgi:hypothetical protein
MSLCRSLIVLWSFSLFTFGCAKNDAPSAEEFKQVLGERLQELKPAGFTVRTVRFEEVRLGEATRGNFPFEVTATVHDYGPGYPANRYYGQTCVGKMDKWKFDMRRDEFGRWFVQGRMTVSDRVCKDKPLRRGERPAAAEGRGRTRLEGRQERQEAAREGLEGQLDTLSWRVRLLRIRQPADGRDGLSARAGRNVQGRRWRARGDLCHQRCGLDDLVPGRLSGWAGRKEHQEFHI